MHAARLGIIGAECSGKSTLATALADTLPACLVPECLREFVDREGRPPRPDEQAALMAEQQQREDEIAAACPLPWTVADPAPLMTAAYSLAYFGDASLVPAAADLAGRYALVAWCDPGIPWVPDPGQRDGVVLRDRVEAALAAIVAEELAPRGIRVLRVRGAVADRVQAVRRGVATLPT